MGCNNSRLNANGDVLPARLRPLLRQRMDEFRKRRSAGVSLGTGEEGGLSQKQLLKDDGAEDGKSRSSCDENEAEETEKKQQNAVVVVRVVEKLSKVVPLPDSECGNEERSRDHKDHDQEKVKDVEQKVEVKSAVPEPQDRIEEANHAKHEEAKNAKHGNVESAQQHQEGNVKLEEQNAQCKEGNAKLEEENAKQKEANAKREEENAKHHDDDEEEEEEEDDEIGRYIGPGSPSFRIYCVEADKRKEEKICEKPIIVMHEKSPSADSSDSGSAASASSGNTGGNSNDVVEIESAPHKRRGSKIMKFGGMKKNLFHVKHLHMNGMNRMMTCTGTDRKSHLSQQ